MPLIPRRCEECGDRRADVERMPDPFVAALAEPGDDIPAVRLCPPCAVARFEES